MLQFKEAKLLSMLPVAFQRALGLADCIIYRLCLNAMRLCASYGEVSKMSVVESLGDDAARRLRDPSVNQEQPDRFLKKGPFRWRGRIFIRNIFKNQSLDSWASVLGFSTRQHWPFPRKYLKNHLVWYSGFSKWTSVLLQVAGGKSEVCLVAQTQRSWRTQLDSQLLG